MASLKSLLLSYQAWLELYKDSVYLKVEPEDKWPEVYAALMKRWRREVLMDLRLLTCPEVFSGSTK